MTIEQAKAELEQVSAKEREAWSAVAAAKEAERDAIAAWNPLYKRAAQLQSFIEMSETESK